MGDENAEVRESIRSSLKKIPDIERLNKRLEKSAITLKELVQLYLFVLELGDMVEILDRIRGPNAKLVDEQFQKPIKKLSQDLNQLAALIMNVVDFDDENCIRDPQI